MPIYLNNLDVVSKVKGLSSALIVPCNMCPAVSVAIRENKPFMQFFRSFLTSPPFEQYIKTLQSQLKEEGVRTRVFKSSFYHQWFLCMWSSGRRRKLMNHAKQYDAVIILGCNSANITVRDAVKSTNCRVIEGMEIAAFMNAKIKFHLPCSVSFEDCKKIPI